MKKTLIRIDEFNPIPTLMLRDWWEPYLVQHGFYAFCYREDDDPQLLSLQTHIPSEIMNEHPDYGGRIEKNTMGKITLMELYNPWTKKVEKIIYD
jgi:hypothetical protein